ncbi:hypothetical protein [Devosia sp.]|uniref:hypothetical protein n=1 Tax=Devosia sp. TaxID=1871048 RepID=UPI00326519AD
MTTLPIRPQRVAAGLVLAAAIASLIAVLLWAIFNAASAAPNTSSSSVDIPHLLRMTSIQAGLTTAISLLVGTALAWCLNRLRFPGRDLVIGIFASAIVTPGMIVAFGMLSIWGRNGWINQTTGHLFGFSIGNPAFGLSGILFAHVILDGAFAARILLARLDAIPSPRLKTGQSLGLSAIQRFAIIDWPAIRGTLPGLAAIIFLLAFTSFPIVLLLGGGPANQTLEVAIYAAIRQDFDLRAAVLLALTQIGVCSLVILASAALPPVPSALGPSKAQSWSDGVLARTLQIILLTLAAAAFILPLLSVLVSGLGNGLLVVMSRPNFWWSLATSLTIGTLSALLTLTLALLLSLGRGATARPGLRILLGVPVYAYLAVPAVVLSLGFFLLVRALGIAPGAAAPVVVVIANALLALPFAVATLGPPLDAITSTRGKLIRSLGLTSWQQFALIEYPLLGRDIGVVLALSFCFSLGDLGVIALFGTQDFTTLPLLMFRALGAYRGNDAAAIAAILLIGTTLAFVALPRLIERLSNVRR